MRSALKGPCSRIWMQVVLVCLLLPSTLLSSDVPAEPLDMEMVEQVRIELESRPREAASDLDEFPTSSENATMLAEKNLAGYGLLRFYGCVTCHVSSGVRDPQWPGPRLDRVGEKLHEDWLRAWIQNPAALRPRSRMPRVPTEDDELDSLVHLLLQQRGASSTHSSETGDPEKGRVLFAEMECLQCHQLGALGDPEGVSLDRTEERLLAPWLAAFLESPDEVQPGTEMIDYEFTREEAGDLAAFLIPEAKSVAERSRESGAARLDLFVEKGCAGCHLLGEPEGSDITADSEHEAFENIEYHRRNPKSSFLITITDPQVRSMTQALMESEPTVDRNATLPEFWNTPIELQGLPPEGYDEEAKSLDPEQCGTCHELQLNDWNDTAHHFAMGPGVLLQILGPGSDPGWVVSCQRCHAPLAEQHQVLPEGDSFGANDQFDEELQSSAIGCAVCHVRQNIRYGPIPGEKPPVTTWRGAGHGGAVALRSFESSEFCAPCHQFRAGELALEGKLLQDTYQEWMQSSQASDGETCQSCHMPARRHLFRGIHDRETTQSAIEVKVELSRASPLEIRLHNRGAGHHLPTYVTPKLFVQAQLLDSDHRVIPGSSSTRVVGREVVLDPGASREIFDTRIPAGGDWVWEYSPERISEASYLEVRIDVHPDHFYLRFFEDYSRDELSEEASQLLDRAIDRVRESPYLLSLEQWPLVP